MSANVSLLNSANSIQRLIQESLGRVHSPERSYSFHKNSLGGQIRPERSPPRAVKRRNTTDFSSGEIAGSRRGPTVPRSFPARSYQAIWLALYLRRSAVAASPPPPAYSSTPVSDAVTGT